MAAKKSFKALREDQNKLLPTHPSDAGKQVPDKWADRKATSEQDKSKSLLPTHSSDASAEVPDSLEGKVGKRAVKPSQDGQAIAWAAGKHGNAEAAQLPESEDKEDWDKEEVKEEEEKDEDKEVKEHDEKGEEEEELKEGDDWEEDLDKMDEEVEDELKKDEVKEEDEKDEDKEEVKEDEDKDADKSEDDEDEELKEHLAALTAGDFLSEDTKGRVKTIFETAVRSSVQKKLSGERKKLQEAFSKVSKRKIRKMHENMAERINSYLDYIVEEWLKENSVAVEAGLRTELAEEFMSKLKNLLEDHFVEVPESKKDLLGEQAEKIEALEKELNDEINKNVDLSKKINEGEKEALVTSLCEGLTALEAEKFKKLIVAVDFSSKEQYGKKLQIIKESYFGIKSKAGDVAGALVEEGGIEAQKSGQINDEMDHYAVAISQSLKK